jgi:hypothetical protein
MREACVLGKGFVTGCDILHMPIKAFQCGILYTQMGVLHMPIKASQFGILYTQMGVLHMPIKAVSKLEKFYTPIKQMSIVKAYPIEVCKSHTLRCSQW